MRPPHNRLAATRARQLRKNLTIPEAIVWAEISRPRLGVRFRRQVPMGPWIVDFASLDPKLVIEIDGDFHDSDESTRTAYLESLGFTVLRLTNEDVVDRNSDFTLTIRTWVHAIREGRNPEAEI